LGENSRQERSPLVWIARGNVALAAVLNAVNTLLAPVLVPALFLALTGITLDVPVAALIAELALTVIVPTVLGVTIRTLIPNRVAPLEPALSATSSLAYLGLLLAVVAPASVALVALRLWTRRRRRPGIGRSRRPHGAAVHRQQEGNSASPRSWCSAAACLPRSPCRPAVYAVVQMLTSPLVARALARRQGDHSADGRAHILSPARRPRQRFAGAAQRSPHRRLDGSGSAESTACRNDLEINSDTTTVVNEEIRGPGWIDAHLIPECGESEIARTRDAERSRCSCHSDVGHPKAVGYVGPSCEALIDGVDEEDMGCLEALGAEDRVHRDRIGVLHGLLFSQCFVELEYSVRYLAWTHRFVAKSF
jgi:hypothetical protein